MTKVSEFRELSDDDLENRLAGARQEMFNLRFQHVTGQLDNYARLGEVRRDVARINTLLREREIEAAEAAEVTAEAMREAGEAERRERVRARQQGVIGGASGEAADLSAKGERARG